MQNANIKSMIVYLIYLSDLVAIFIQVLKVKTWLIIQRLYIIKPLDASKSGLCKYLLI